MTLTTTPGSATPLGAENPLRIELNSKLYSNFCKRLGTYLKDQQGLTVSHTTLRTAMSEVLGFSSPNHLDSLLQEQDATAKKVHIAEEKGTAPGAAPEAAKSGGPQSRSMEGWSARQEVLRTRLTDLIAEDIKSVAADLGNLSLALFAEQFPPNLTALDKRKIRENFPGATDALIAKRAMSEEGVLYAIALARQTSIIALDYFPESNCEAAKCRDDSQQPVIIDILIPALNNAFDQAVSAGLSPFGAATVMILIGAMTGVEKGVHWAAMARPLVEALEPLCAAWPDSGKPVMLSKEAEDKILKKVMEQMGISRAEAKRYLAFAQAQRANQSK